MGRTYRKRKRRPLSNLFSNLSSSQYFIKLYQWLKEHQWTAVSSLLPAEIFKIGRGFVAREFISKDSIIVKIPIGLLITVSTAAASDIGWLFNINSSEQFFAQEVIAIFLQWEKHLGQHSTWRPYINTLPTNYSLPLLCSKEELDVMSSFLSEQILIQKLKCMHGFEMVKRLIKDRACHHCSIPLNDIFNYKDYQWAWCTVNSRCVYIDENCIKHGLNLQDKASLALAPYLDMLNHSNTARVKVGLSVDKKYYEIKTLEPFRKYSQVFINYGHHSNLKLCLEYGFVLPHNSNDTVPFSLEDMLSCFENERKIQHDAFKMDFLRTHGLTRDLYCSQDDLSFNTKAAIVVLISDEKRKEIVTQKIYSCQFDEEVIGNMGKLLIQKKCLEFQNILKAMDEKISRGCTESFRVARDLVLQNLHTLTSCADSISPTTCNYFVFVQDP